MSQPAAVYHLALRDLHAAAGAKFAMATGWSLPMEYATGLPEEYSALRGRAVVFDRSQRSRFLVTGTDALDVLRRVFAGHVEEIDEGRAMRTVALDEEGELRDIALVARTGGIAYLVSGEPGQRAETMERLHAAVGPDFDVRIDDRTESTCLIGLAGPGAAEVVASQMAEAVPGRLQSLHCVTFQFHGFRGFAVRTSDTGEDGFEFMVAPAVAQHLIETLREAGVPLCGNAALEAARVEACVPAFDPDLLTGLSPAEADLDVLLELPPGREGRTLSAVVLDGDPVAAGTPILMDGAVVGEIRSCLWSPGLNTTAGLGIIDSRRAFPGQSFTAGTTGGTVVVKPLYRRRT